MQAILLTAIEIARAVEYLHSKNVLHGAPPLPHCPDAPKPHSLSFCGSVHRTYYLLRTHINGIKTSVCLAHAAIAGFGATGGLKTQDIRLVEAPDGARRSFSAKVLSVSMCLIPHCSLEQKIIHP